MLWTLPHDQRSVQPYLPPMVNVLNCRSREVSMAKNPEQICLPFLTVGVRVRLFKLGHGAIWRGCDDFVQSCSCVYSTAPSRRKLGGTCVT